MMCQIRQLFHSNFQGRRMSDAMLRLHANLLIKDTCILLVHILLEVQQVSTSTDAKFIAVVVTM